MYSEKPDNTKQKVAAGLVVLAVIAILALGATVYNGKQNPQTAATTSTSSSASSTPASTVSDTTQTTASTTTTSSSSSYKDGTFSASSDYYVPHGSENIKVMLTVKNGVVTDSSVNNSEYDRESASFQEEFAAEYKNQVVGKSLSGLQLYVVAGASDTTQGFNDAVSQIQTEARA